MSLPTDVADQVDDQRRRLAQLAAERAADDVLTDPAGWRSRERDRAAMESSIASRMEQLITGAANDAANNRPHPAIRADRCCGCDRRIASGRAMEKADGPCCNSCAWQSPAERALHRRVRSVPPAELPSYLDALTDTEMSDVFHLVASHAPRDAHELRTAVHAAVRRRRRSGPASSDRQRRRLADSVSNAAAAGTTNRSTADAWADLSATIRPQLAPAAHLDEPATRAVMDRLDPAELRDLRRLVARVRDLTAEAVVVAELRRRR